MTLPLHFQFSSGSLTVLPTRANRNNGWHWSNGSSSIRHTTKQRCVKVSVVAKRRYGHGRRGVQDDSPLVWWKLEPKLLQFRTQAHSSREQRCVQLRCWSTSHANFLRRRLSNVCEEWGRRDNHSDRHEEASQDRGLQFDEVDQQLTKCFICDTLWSCRCLVTKPLQCCHLPTSHSSIKENTGTAANTRAAIAHEQDNRSEPNIGYNAKRYVATAVPMFFVANTIIARNASRQRNVKSRAITPANHSPAVVTLNYPLLHYIVALTLHTLKRYTTIIQWACAGNSVCGIKASISHLQLWVSISFSVSKQLNVKCPGCRPPPPKRSRHIVAKHI